MALALETTVLGIGELLSRRTFAVPEHQRAYAWTESQVLDLWHDVSTALIDEPDGYFLGQIVLGAPTANGQRASVIDGQQRLATTSLLYGALVAELKSRTEDADNGSRAETIETRFIADRDLVSMERSYFVQMGPSDNEFFVALLDHAVTGTVVPNPDRESHRLMREAYELLRKLIAEHAPSEQSGSIEKFIDLVEYVRKQVTVIQVEAGTEDNAFVLFETLNDRGVMLTPADLLKNLLFSRAKARLPETMLAWSNMLGTLDVLEDRGAVTAFIRHYWISTEGPVRDRHLYKTLKESVRTPSEVSKFAAMLSKSAESYVAIANPGSSSWSTTAEREAIETIGLFKAKTVRPLLLAVLETTNSGKVRRDLVAQVARSTVRLAVAGRLGSGTTEDAAGDAARKVRKGNVKTAAKLRSCLGQYAVSDADFESALRTWKIRNSRQSRYILRELEVCARTIQNLGVELIPNGNEETVNLEHILPKNPRHGDWPSFSNDEVSVFAHRLGNQVLLLKSANKGLKNGGYESKEPVLTQSELITTKQSGGKSDWTKTAIEDRQNMLAKLAIRIW